MMTNVVDPLAYAADADPTTLEDVARLDSLRNSIKAEHSGYLAQHPEIASLVDAFISAVLEEKPADVFLFARKHFAPDNDGVNAVVIAGPSGVGKGTIIKRLMEQFPQKFGFGCSHTTRGRREREEDGVHYHFTTIEAMREGIARGDFIEHAEVHGNLYGTSVAAVADVAKRGQVCLLDIDVQGVKAVKESSLCPKFIFVAPPSMEGNWCEIHFELKRRTQVLEQRLRDRGTETEETLSRRLHNAREELEYGRRKGNFDVLVENDDLEHAVADLSRCLQQWYPIIEADQGT